MNEKEANNTVNLANARKSSHASNPISETKKLALSIGKKLSKHWIILFAAVVFDIFGLVPILSVLTNLAFGALLFLYFGSKKKKSATDTLLGIVLPIVLGSALDWFLSVIPTCILAALIRISRSDDIE
ncbi:MAG: hypothetical protein Q7S18_03375 [bacterium]|nr:hypothetical protein [bacterium]